MAYLDHDSFVSADDGAAVSPHDAAVDTHFGKWAVAA
jgi:hypothetical protein